MRRITQILAGLMLAGFGLIIFWSIAPAIFWIVICLLLITVVPYGLCVYIAIWDNKYGARVIGPATYDPHPAAGKKFTAVKCERCGKLSTEPVSKVTPFMSCECGEPYHIVERNLVSRWL